MLSNEDVLIKISNDFHAEINPILEQINSESKQSVWFNKKSISGKFYIIKNLLLSLNGAEVNLYQLAQLKSEMESFQLRLTEYFKSSDIATCFVYTYPENFKKTRDFFHSLIDYSLNQSVQGEIGYYFMIGMEITGFPNDCSNKLFAKISNNELVINQQRDPIFPNEIERGKQIGNPIRTRNEQDEINHKLHCQNPELWEKQDLNALQCFTDFAEKTNLETIALLEDFDRCINLCNSIIEKKQKDTTPANLPEIEKIYSVLINGYIQEPFERFQAIFQNSYSGEKLLWLKTGTELKYFVDRLNEKLDLSNEINKWTGARFQFMKPVKNMTEYLSKQTSKDEYQLLIQGNLKKNLIYKLFRE